MDMQLTVKIVHMISVTLLIGVVIARAFTLFVGVQGNQPNPVARKLFVALQHLSMTLIVLTGLTSLVIKNFERRNSSLFDDELYRKILSK